MYTTWLTFPPSENVLKMSFTPPCYGVPFYFLCHLDKVITSRLLVQYRLCYNLQLWYWDFLHKISFYLLNKNFVLTDHIQWRYLNNKASRKKKKMLFEINNNILSQILISIKYSRFWFVTIFEKQIEYSQRKYKWMATAEGHR